MATYYRYHSEYVSNDFFLLISAVIALFGFIFIAPGAVVVHHVRKIKHLGIISLVGPLTNVVLAILCAVLMQFYPVFTFGYYINSWLALFNMIPFLGMDGQKILAWSKPVYFGTAIVIFALYMGTFFL
jgi:Zn-dependent protease